jgi:hypothetical protein
MNRRKMVLGALFASIAPGLAGLIGLATSRGPETMMMTNEKHAIREN